MRYRFEDLELDEERFELRRGHVVIDIEPQSLRLLLRLVEADGAVVARDELIRDVLGVDHASDDALFKAVQRARRAVGDDGRAQRLIKTVAGRGYRFVGELLDPPPAANEADPDRAPGVPRVESADPSRATPLLAAQDASTEVSAEPVELRPRPHRLSWLPVALLLLVVALGIAWGTGRSTERMGDAVSGFDLELMTPEQIDEVWRSLPASAHVATAVVDGLRHLREGDPRAACARLDPAHAAAPDDPFVGAAMARTQLALGDFETAAAMARTAFEAARKMPARRRLDLDALVLETEGDLDAAAARYDALFALAPEQPRYALAALRCRVESGRAHLDDEFAEVEARLALHELSEETEAERLGLEARHRLNGGDFAGATHAAAQLEELAQSRGLSGLVARARWMQVEALQALGRFDAALALVQEAPGLDALPDGELRSTLVRSRDHAYRGQGDQALALLDALRSDLASKNQTNNLPLALALAADASRLALQRRDLQAAEELGAEAIRIARRLGNRGRLATLLRRQADVLADQTRFDEAESLYLEALAQHRAFGDRTGEAGVLFGLGLMHRLDGDPYRAAERLAESETLYASLERPARRSIVLYNLASVNVSLCRLDAAQQQLEQSRLLEDEMEQPGGVAWALHGLALVSFEQGELERAAEQIQEALALRRSVGDSAGVVASEVRRALVLDRSDRSTEALEVLDRLLAGPLEKPSEMRNLALNLRSYALIHLGRLEAAAANVVQARRANAEIGVAFSSTLTDLTAADLELQLGAFDAARALAARARDRAEKLHDLAALVEARRLLLESEHRLGLGSQAARIERAQALVDDAERFGCTERARTAAAWLARLRAGQD